MRRRSSQRRTHCRHGHALRGNNIKRKRQTSGRITRLCRRCYQVRRRVWQRLYRASGPVRDPRTAAVSLLAPDLTTRVCALYAQEGGR
jgi:hypothetical protein